MIGPRLLLLFSFLGGAAPSGVRAAPHAPPKAKPKIAVLEIRPVGTDAFKAEVLSEVALTEAGAVPGVDVIGRSDVVAIIGFEKQKRAAGCTDDSSCLAEIGGALGVDFILVGSLGQIGTLARIDLKLVETRRARVANRVGVSVEGREERMVEALQRAVRDLLAPVAASASPTATSGSAPKAAPQLTPDAGAALRPDTGTAPGARLPLREPDDPNARVRAAGWWTAGAGLVLLAGAGALEVLANAKDRSIASGGLATGSDIQKTYDSAKTYRNSAIALFAGGGAAVAVGATLALTHPAARTKIGVSVLPNGIAISARTP